MVFLRRDQSTGSDVVGLLPNIFVRCKIETFSEWARKVLQVAGVCLVRHDVLAYQARQFTQGAPGRPNCTISIAVCNHIPELEVDIHITAVWNAEVKQHTVVVDSVGQEPLAKEKPHATRQVARNPVFGNTRSDDRNGKP